MVPRYALSQGCLTTKLPSVTRRCDRSQNSLLQSPYLRTASGAFWWSPVFGKPLLDKPTVEADNGYAAKLAAYRAQQEAIEDFAELFQRA